METHAGSRPSLQPIFTEYHNLEGYPRSAFSIAYSPYTSSPSSPRAMPTLVYPPSPSPRGEASPRRYERAPADSYDLRRRRESITPDGHRRNLGAIAEHSPTSPRAFWPAPGASFSQTRRSSGYQIPRHLSQVPRRQSIVEETRSLLLTGIPSEHMRSIGRAMAHSERRRSLPNSPLTARRRHSTAVREQLLVWGHVYYGNAASADCFVVAVALRRPSDTPSVGKENDKSEPPADEKPGKASSSRVTIRARVRPRDIERKPFILQRSFDLDEIRSTIPDPPATPASARRESASVELLSPSAAVTPRSADFRRRASSTSSQGETLGDGKDGKDGVAESINRKLIRGANALPMHITYARISLPVLAALMVSGHVRKGDIIDLPMPHPEVWPQTVAHVYTGQVELTEPIKQNILHLGGRVV
ncbi:hypothetical protein CONLIGDRAFT_674108 [Coniochaeta ligniaria NRRL 30616]|uniref:Uncharacterized protein n=1 Tax=Coniochaeta ligniaria NRRL 30616 TaxID=1408157 RepID=A0A1J7J282_9PEZI|nr:hypothetical protein CONLIGDRAFT_674108 [Coniochaeta ligniaria NRRL 30616]